MVTKDEIRDWAKNRWQGSTMSNIIDYQLKKEEQYDMKPINDGVIWSRNQVKMIYEAFEYGYWDKQLIAFYLADQMQKTVGAILYQWAHIFQDNPGFHRNRYAAEFNRIVLKNRRGL